MLFMTGIACDNIITACDNIITGCSCVMSMKLIVCYKQIKKEAADHFGSET